MGAPAAGDNDDALTSEPPAGCVAQVTGAGRGMSVVAVPDLEATRAAVELAEAALAASDILVNNAGIGADRVELDGVTPTMFDRMFAVHA